MTKFVVTQYLAESKYSEILLDGMKEKMLSEGKADATISKYLRDARGFLDYLRADIRGGDGCLRPESIRAYRDHISMKYKKRSVNSMLAGVNYLIGYCGRDELKLQTYKIQREVFRDDESELTLEEYRRLIYTAEKQGKDRLCMIMLTLGSTGIRVSELPFITVESLISKTACVSLKGKTRQVILPESLCCRLAAYAAGKGIEKGSIFITKGGRPVDRTNILHDMKKLCENARVDPKKVHPHNLRHLFASTYYDKYRDLAHLADILGHSNVNTTRIYTAVPRTELTKNIDGLGLASI